MFYHSKENQKNVKNKIVEYNLYLIAHNGSGSDSYVVLNNLPQWRSVVKPVKNGTGIMSLKIFNGYVDEKKKIPQYVHFRCGRVHINKSLKKIGESYKLQESLFKKNYNVMKYMRIHGKLKKTNGYRMLKMTFYQLLSVMLDIHWEWKN